MAEGKWVGSRWRNFTAIAGSPRLGNEATLLPPPPRAACYKIIAVLRVNFHKPHRAYTFRGYGGCCGVARSHTCVSVDSQFAFSAAPSCVERKLMGRGRGDEI